ncbi:MAG: winged helix-turn-helix domain-containing protein [Oscillospiraceae bacterium]
MIIRKKILLADAGMLELNRRVLEDNGYDLLVSSSAKETSELTASHCPDIVVINTCVRDFDVPELLTQLRSWSDVPVLLVCSTAERYLTYQESYGGKLDFITKPVDTAGLLVRIRAMFNWCDQCEKRNSSEKNQVKVGNITIDYDKYRVFVGDRDAELTLNEYRIAALLGRNVGMVITYEEIMRRLWGPNNVGDNQILRVHMSNIRRKVEEDTASPKYFHTVNGVGYRIAEE